MRNTIIIILALLSVHIRSLAQQAPVPEAASAYAFIIDSVIIKELNKYTHLKNHRLAITGLSSKYLHDSRMYRGFWNDVQNYSSVDTTTSQLYSLLDSAPGIEIEKIRNYSSYPDRILSFDTSKGIRSELMYARDKTMICLMSNLIFSRDYGKAIIFYSLGSEGGFTVVLKRDDKKWELVLKRMDFIY